MDVKIASLVGGTIATSVASGKWCAQLKNHRRSCTQPLRSSTPSPLPQFTEAVRRRLSTGGAQSKGVLRATARFEYKGGNTLTLFQDREESESGDVCSSAASVSAIQSTTLDRIRSAGVIACLRAESAEVALEAGRAALNGGILVLEVTMRTPGAPEVIKKLVQEHPWVIIGAGTVLTCQEAQRAKEAGAKFLMSPVALKKLVMAHKNSPVLFIPGAMTPSEVFSAFHWGAPSVKLYPVSLMGSVKFVKAITQSFPYIPVIASNGIGLDEVEPYLRAGATAVVLSDAIFRKSAMDKHDYDEITQHAKVAARTASAVVGWSNNLSTWRIAKNKVSASKVEWAFLGGRFFRI